MLRSRCIFILYHRLYSASGSIEKCRLSSCRYIHNTSFGTYSFNTLNAVPDPGPKRPFNFFGSFDKVGILPVHYPYTDINMYTSNNKWV